jgi:hypothetical protein
VSKTRYAEVVSAFDSLVDYALTVSSELVGHASTEEHLGYADPIFAKLVCHAVSLRKLLPHPDDKPRNELWDISSTSAIARSLIEAFDALAYIAINNVSPEEREFRILLWELHDQVRRKKMLEHIGSQNPKVAEIHSSAALLQEKVTRHSFYANVAAGIRSKVTRDDAPPFHLSQQERCVTNGIDFDYYNAATMHLSQFVHTLPFAIHQLTHFRAGEADSLILMSLPVQYSTAFLGKAIDGMRMIFPGKLSEPPAVVAMEIQVHVEMLASGLKSAG